MCWVLRERRVGGEQGGEVAPKLLLVGLRLGVRFVAVAGTR